jgi:hypothetical protein
MICGVPGIQSETLLKAGKVAAEYIIRSVVEQQRSISASILDGSYIRCYVFLGIKAPTGHLAAHSRQGSHFDSSPKKAIFVA